MGGRAREVCHRARTNWRHLTFGQVACDIECSVKHAEHLDVVLWRHEISDPVVTVEENADVRLFAVAIADLGKFQEDFCALVVALTMRYAASGLSSAM